MTLLTSGHVKCRISAVKIAVQYHKAEQQLLGLNETWNHQQIKTVVKSASLCHIILTLTGDHQRAVFCLSWMFDLNCCMHWINSHMQSTAQHPPFVVDSTQGWDDNYFFIPMSVTSSPYYILFTFYCHQWMDTLSMDRRVHLPFCCMRTSQSQLIILTLNRMVAYHMEWIRWQKVVSMVTTGWRKQAVCLFHYALHPMCQKWI